MHNWFVRQLSVGEYLFVFLTFVFDPLDPKTHRKQKILNLWNFNIKILIVKF